jgi:hypothetical protein
MTAKEWREHTDERIAALFVALEANAKTMSEMFAETNRRINDSHDKTMEEINGLVGSQIEANRRMDRFEEKIERVIDKVDSWLEGLKQQNGNH